MLLCMGMLYCTVKWYYGSCVSKIKYNFLRIIILYSKWKDLSISCYNASVLRVYYVRWLSFQFWTTWFLTFIAKIYYTKVCPSRMDGYLISVYSLPVWSFVMLCKSVKLGQVEFWPRALFIVYSRNIFFFGEWETWTSLCQWVHFSLAAIDGRIL